MRLIDANEIAEELYGLRIETRCANEPFLAGKSDAYWDAHGMVIEARTIDAVPVEWLKDMADKTNNCAETHFAFMYVLHEWQKEKERKNEIDRCGCPCQDHGEDES